MKLHFLANLFLLLCTNSFTATKPPDWIYQHPNDSEYFIGIGHSMIKDNQDYQNEAKILAFNDIATQIEVTIKAVSEHELIENTGVVTDYTMMRTQTSSDIKIENIELFDSWKDKKEYWVYYRISKAEYQRIRKEKIESSVNISKGFYEQSLENLKTGMFAYTIQDLYQAYNAICPYIGETLKVTSMGEEIQIDQKIIQKINELQNSILLEFSSNTANCKKGKVIGMSIPLTVSIFSNNKKYPVSGIPISFSLLQGKGIVTKYAVTDTAGKIDFRVDKMYLNSQDGYIEATVNTDSLIARVNPKNKETYYPEFKPAKGILNIYCQSLNVNISEKSTDFQNRTIIKTPLFTYVEKALIELGMQLVSDGASDLVITINSNCHKGKQIAGMNAVTILIDAVLSITDATTGIEYCRENFVNQKGVASTYEDAQSKAFQNLGMLLMTQVLPQKIAAIFNN